jgi:hypothetical protein
LLHKIVVVDQDNTWSKKEEISNTGVALSFPFAIIFDALMSDILIWGIYNSVCPGYNLYNGGIYNSVCPGYNLYNGGIYNSVCPGYNLYNGTDPTSACDSGPHAEPRQGVASSP